MTFPQQPWGQRPSQPSGQPSFPPVAYGQQGGGYSVPVPPGGGYPGSMPPVYGPPGYGPPGSPRSKRRRWLWLIPVVVLVIAIAAAITITLITLKKGDSGYSPPANGSGYSTKPIDQPMPAPTLGAAHPCDWLSQVMPQFKQKFNATGKVESEADSCHVVLPDGEDLQVALDAPYTALSDPTNFLQPLQLDGLDGRVFAYSAQYSGECNLHVDIRAIYALQVNRWNIDKDKSNDGRRQARCEQSKEAADIIVKAFVPLAGGTPYPGTVQEPGANMLTGKKACQAVTPGPIIYADDIADEHPKEGSNQLGTTCEFSGHAGTVTVLLTSSAVELAAFPSQLPKAVVTQGKLGVMAARTEQTADACNVAVQLKTGQVFAFTYRTQAHRSTVCHATEAVAAAALGDLMGGKPGG